MDDVLKNPLRRRILEILYSKKSATAKEISEELNIGVPAVYYHLELMKGYVAKTGKGEFAATKMGLDLYREAVTDDMVAKNPVSKVIPFLSVVERLSAPKKLLPISAAIGLIEFILCYYENFRPFLFGYAASSTSNSLIVFYFINILVLFAIMEAISYAATRRVGGELLLLNGIMISRLPLMLIIVPYLFNLGGTLVSLITFALGPLFSIVILSLFTSVAKGIRYEITIIMSFILLYIDIFIYTVR